MNNPNHIQKLLIENFKSIKNLNLQGFKRINLFIGRPNVGKSNIIEAFSLCSSFASLSKPQKITDLIRVENRFELFYEGNYKEHIYIEAYSDMEESFYASSTIIFFANDNLIAPTFKLNHINGRDQEYYQEVYYITDNLSLDKQLKLIKFPKRNPIKKYHFNPYTKPTKNNTNNTTFLQPPFGNNLLSSIERLPDLKNTIIELFQKDNQKIVFDKTSQSLKVMKELGNEIILLPFSSMADTLQRLIFFKTAIASNANSVLLFEEPEAHAFPPYIVHITQDIIKSETNQFFITTHSPFVVNDFLENAIDDLAIFVVDYKDKQTIVKALTKEQLDEMYEYGIDLFSNLENYL
jgi:AAA15 family ATPase/GTPase